MIEHVQCDADGKVDRQPQPGASASMVMHDIVPFWSGLKSGRLQRRELLLDRRKIKPYVFPLDLPIGCHVEHMQQAEL